MNKLSTEEVMEAFVVWLKTGKNSETARITGHSEVTIAEYRRSMQWDSYRDEVVKVWLPRRLDEIIREGDLVATTAMRMMAKNLQRMRERGEDELPFNVSDYVRLIEMSYKMAGGYTERVKVDFEIALNVVVEKIVKILGVRIQDAGLRELIAQDLAILVRETDIDGSSGEATVEQRTE